MTEAFKDAKEKSLFCARAALEKKAFNIIILELKKVSAVTDYFVICSGRSDRQVQAIAQFIDERMREKGIRPLGEEGMQQGRWILMDYADVVIHIFYDQVRLHYDLEGLWREAAQIDVPRIEASEGKG
ncbi:MAG: ribosome silencing factor [Deltaproteobacteria bacterium RBG_16_54_18]|jgi:ribosome-associated protein|nr:MAG: ribosome silencing factor [Deltaproteobacteria bacterium RBG_16_54_18]